MLSYRNTRQLLMTLLCYDFQVEDAIVKRKKAELLEKYASEALMQQSEEARTLLGL